MVNSRGPVSIPYHGYPAALPVKNFPTYPSRWKGTNLMPEFHNYNNYWSKIGTQQRSSSTAQSGVYVST